MRYLVGFVLALALLASPLSVGAEPTQKGSPELPSWLQMELHAPGLGMTYSESQQLALIPQHLQQRTPGHRYEKPRPAEKPIPSDPAPDVVDEPSPKPEPYTVDPELSPVGIQRWHPAAFDPAVKSQRELEIEYKKNAAATEASHRKGLSKGGKIAIGVIVPLVVVGVAVGAGVAASFRNWE